MSVEARVRAGGLLGPGAPVLVLLSGGRDSVCLLDLAVRIGCEVARAARRPRPAARFGRGCRVLRGALRVSSVELTVRHAGESDGGNVQAWARERRYARPRELAEPLGAAIATGHTATDQVETVLYRLAASPGRRALLGMAADEPRRRAPRAARAPAAGGHARGDGGLLRRARAAVARGPQQRVGRLRAQPRARRAAARAAAACTRRPRPTSCARSRCCATRPRCSTPPSTPR